MARRASKRAKSSALSIPSLAGVDTMVVIPEGEYLAKVVTVEEGEGDKGPYLKWTIAVAEGDFEDKKAKPYYTSFAPDSLFNLRGMLEAVGVEIPDEAFELEPDDLVDLELMIAIEHETYQGKKQSVIVDFWPVDEGEADPEPKEKPKRGAKKAAAAEDEEEKPKRGRRSSRKDEEDEEEEKPARGKAKRSAKKKAPAKVSADDVEDMDQEQLEELIEEHDLDIDLGEFKTLRKMRNKVLDVLEEAELLED